MALIHNNKLRVNSEVPDDAVDIWRENGWAGGLHKDSDPDDLSPVPRVLPEPEPEEPSDTKAVKTAATKKG